jgi:hypothetical protein
MLESFKQKIQDKIENNTYKSQLTWEDRDGNKITDEVLLKRSRLPIVGDWARIYPPLTETGRINWINLIFGGKKNFIKIVLIVGIVVLFLLAIYESYNNYNIVINNTCVQNCLKLVMP